MLGQRNLSHRLLSTISTTIRSSNGGSLIFDLQDLLLLRGGSEISTEAGTEQAGGDGGDITIDTQFVVAVPNENSGHHRQLSQRRLGYRCGRKP